jgi:hypothetical protein
MIYGGQRDTRNALEILMEKTNKMLRLYHMYIKAFSSNRS